MRILEITVIGRTEEIETLEEIYRSKKPEFLALYGRRRVGKTYLIRQFFFSKKEVVFFNVTGREKGKAKEQLKHFCQVMGDVFYGGAPLIQSPTWDEALRMLTKCLNNLQSDKKIVLFFDELPWMATKNSRLFEAIDYYWNQYWSNDSRITFIVCGSSASWIIRKIINNKGGLHNRITRKIHLEPLNLLNTKIFLEHMNIHLSNRQITLIISIIAEYRYGIGKRKLLEAMGKESVGSTGAKRLEELEQTGFIMSFTPLYQGFLIRNTCRFS